MRLIGPYAAADRVRDEPRANAGSRTAVPRSEGIARFLFSVVAEEQGRTITVSSAFARLGFDPWLEAETLTKLPRADATSRLACVIFTACLCCETLLEAETVAIRLVGRLPAEQEPVAPASELKLLPVIAVALAAVWLALAFAGRYAGPVIHHSVVPAARLASGAAPSPACPAVLP